MLIECGTILRLHRWSLASVVALAIGISGGDASWASDHGAASAHGHGGHSDGADSASTSAAVALGEYRIRSYYPVQAQKSIVRFMIYATAPPDRLADAQELAANRRHKIRDQIIIAARMMALAEFDDPDLARFRRRILLRLRRALPELPIEDVYISNFELQVQSL
jgi:hypothetical protein